MVVERGECSMFDTHTFSRISFPVIMARTNGKSFFVSFNRFGEEYNLLRPDKNTQYHKKDARENQ